MSSIRIALIGMGKIARDQHVPALARNGAFELVAAASPHQRLEGVPNFTSIDALLEAMPDLDAVALCTPPQLRYPLGRLALENGLHVLLEKPPGATLNEVAALVDLAGQKKVALFAAWHSCEAAAVGPARRWLQARKISSVTVTWKEDVRVWHPGQTWIWKAGGLGVFDPGINALSIVTRIMPAPVFIASADLFFPENRATPIAANIRFASNLAEVDWNAEFDWRQTGEQTWDILIETGEGERLALRKGGSRLEVDGRLAVEAKPQEYEMIYERFAELLDGRTSEIHEDPLRLVADAFMVGRRIAVEPFID